MGLGAAISNSREVSDSKRAAVAEKIARDVVDSDPAILGMLVLDLHEKGRVLAVARSASLPPERQVSPALVERFAIAANVVWGAAETAAQVLGRREFIVGAFKEQLVLLVELREYEMLLGFRLSRSSNAEHIFAGVASLLGIG